MKPRIMTENETNARYEFSNSHTYLKKLEEPIKRFYGKVDDYMKNIFNPLKDKLADVYNKQYSKLEKLVDHYKANHYNREDKLEYQQY